MLRMMSGISQPLLGLEVHDIDLKIMISVVDLQRAQSWSLLLTTPETFVQMAIRG